MKALILAGGRSSRMGEDKLLLKIDGQHPVLLMREYLESRGIPVFLSRAKDQMIPEGWDESNVIRDQFTDQGPMGGIFSAMAKVPSECWLVLACDMFGVNSKTVHKLIEERDPLSDATVCYNEERQSIEPLCAIWETKLFKKMSQSVQEGKLGVTRFLIEKNIKRVSVTDTFSLLNCNSPEDFINTTRNLKVVHPEGVEPPTS